MRWSSSDRRSDNIEDRRGISLGRGAAVGGGSVVVALVLALLGAPSELVQSVLQGGGTTAGPATERPIDPAEQPTVEMLQVTLADTEDVWKRVLGSEYEEPKLVLFKDQVESACGLASSAVGPFYCPGDRKAYLDIAFFRDLEQKFGAPGNFAQAYVVAHEIGHHVQTLTGVSQKVHAARGRLSQGEANQLSVRQELQADCFAGIWAHHTSKMKDRIVDGDIEAGLRAASAIGDDTLQKRSRGQVVPESFTHGSSAQRMTWFKRGLQVGTMEACDAFKQQI